MDDDLRHREIEVPGGLVLQMGGLQPSMTAVLRAVKRSEHGLFNCVASIAADWAFVADVAAAFAPYPLLVNLRCGAWYAPAPADSCYFKSTDGHSGQWAFSTARLNLHVAAAAAAAGGVAIVDATRRGKTFPDALTKTVPIWAAVLNAAAARLRGDASWARGVHLPTWISRNEANQIEQRLEGWVDALLRVGGDLAPLAALAKPLRCVWVSQELQEGQAEDWEDLADRKGDLEFTPVVLISASLPSVRHRRRLTLDSEEFEEETDSAAVGLDTPIDVMYDYVPGAGDDEESWAKGLTPALMWRHLGDLLGAGPEGAGEVVARVAKEGRRARGRTGAGARAAPREWRLRWLGGGLGLAHFGAPEAEAAAKQCLEGGGAVLNVGSTEPEWLQAAAAPAPPEAPVQYLWVPVAGDKAPKTAALRAIPAAAEFCSPRLAVGRRVVVVAEAEALDLAAAVLLGCLLACYSLEDGADAGTAGGLTWARPAQFYPGRRQLVPAAAPGGAAAFSRVVVRQYLATVAAAYPGVVLSQSLLRQVFNAFLPHAMRPPAEGSGGGTGDP